MTPPDAPKPDLSSWKEIAAHLKVSVRTAQGWERDRGLPIRRLPGPRGRVIASAAELDAWRFGAIPKSSAEPVPLDAPSSSKSRVMIWCLAVLLLLVTAIITALLVRRPQPATARIAGSRLIVTDNKDRLLWQQDYHFPLMDPVPRGEVRSPMTWVGDLDGDGHNEVLVVPMPNDNENLPKESPPLICYSDRGKELWRYVQSTRLTSGNENDVFAPIYMTARFLVAPLGPKGALEIALVANHYLDYPGHVVLLSGSGRVLREYWHSGQLDFLEIGQRNGKPVLWLSGISNAWKSATLIALDPADFDGASQEPEHPAYQLQGFRKGRELSRILIGRSCLNLAANRYNSSKGLWLHPDEILVETGEQLDFPGPQPGIFHHFSPDLTVHRIERSDSYETALDRARKSGLVKSCAIDESNTIRILK